MIRYCKDCHKILNNFYALRCKSCSHKGKLNWNFKGGEISRIIKCMDCNKKLNESAYYRGDKRCKSCVRKLSNKINNPTKNPETMKKILKNRKSVKGKNNPMYGKPAPKGSGLGKGQYYKSIWMRSSYEIRYAKYLDKQNIKWLYEFKRFDLGNTTYTPDFYLPKLDIFIEVKGWWRPKAIKKFKLFKKLYPKINIKIITKKELNQNEKANTKLFKNY